MSRCSSGCLTTIQIIEEEVLAEKAAELGEYAMGRLLEFGGTGPVISDVRGRDC